MCIESLRTVWCFNRRHVFRAYTILLDDRDRVREFLAARGISTRVYYNPPLHLQPAFRHLGYRSGAFPAAERTAERMLSLPIYPTMNTRQIDRVAAAMADWERLHLEHGTPATASRRGTAHLT